MTARQGIEIDYCPNCRGATIGRRNADDNLTGRSAGPANGIYYRSQSYGNI